MFNKKTLPLAALALLVAAAVLAGASQVIGQQQPAGQVINYAGAPTDTSPAVVQAAPALPAATGQVTFNDAFDNAPKAGWRTLADAPGTWAVVDTRLEQWGDADGQPSDDASVYVAANSALSDGTFEAQVYPTSGEALGVVFRGSDNGYYRLTIAPNLPNQAPKALLHVVTPSGAQQIAANTTWAGYERGRWSTITVSTSGGQLTVSVDGTQLFSVQDSTFTSGWEGVWSVADRGARFDNVRVQSTAAGR